MPTRALVFCNDEKAFDAVTQILTELEVDFEHAQDVTAADQRLAAQAFDLALIDCDRESDATRLFSTLRSSKLNNRALPVAVVDGKAGLPTAFRLGAGLVVPKPVSLEQTRGTIRMALAMYKKAHPESNSPSPSLPAHSHPQPEVIEEPKPAAAAPVSAKPGPTLVPPKPKSAMLSNIAKPGLSFSKPTDEITGSSEQHKKPVEAPLLREKPGYPLPAENFAPRQSQRPASRALIAALVLAMIGAAGYAAYSMVPSFHTLANTQYQLVRSSIPGLKSSTPVKPQVPVHTATKPVAPAPAPVPPPDGFVATAPDSTTAEVPSSETKKPVILATSATTPEPAAPASEPASITVPDELASQHISSRVDPIYSDALRRKGIRGEVVLQATVAKDGSVDSVSVVSGNPQLAAAAMDAVKQWRYQTYLHDGVATGFQTNVTLEFGASEKAAH